MKRRRQVRPNLQKVSGIRHDQSLTIAQQPEEIRLIGHPGHLGLRLREESLGIAKNVRSHRN